MAVRWRAAVWLRFTAGLWDGGWGLCVLIAEQVVVVPCQLLASMDSRIAYI